MRRPGSQSPPDERKSPLAVGASSWIQHVWIQLSFFVPSESISFPVSIILHKQYIMKIPRTPYFNIKC